jgi:hypothetical protein
MSKTDFGCGPARDPKRDAEILAYCHRSLKTRRGGEMRAAFVILPAWAFGIVALAIHPLLAIAVHASILYIGWHVTEPRPERGEHK